MKDLLHKLTTNGLVILALAFAVVGLAGAPLVMAVDPKVEVLNGVTQAGGTATPTTLPTLIQTIISLLLFVAGAVAVIMIILGGIRYITSNGDQAQVKAAKETIMYSIIGLVVAILAYAIVQFIVSKL